MADTKKPLHGIFDNRRTMHREVWMEGVLKSQWHAAMCSTYLGVGIESLLPWQRKALEELWGFYPDSPRQD